MANLHGPGDHRRHGNTAVPNNYGGYQASSAVPQVNYPPPHNQSNPSFYKMQPDLNMHKNEDVVIDLYTSRTPSPTPSEHAMLNRKGFIDWKKMTNWRFWIRREWLWYYVLLVILLIIVILISVYDRQIVRWLEPTAQKIKNLPAGWLIPIAIFFILSFPPLFGHEIIAILCGVVWGLWIGFAITAAGTFVGELGNFYAFKYCCRARGDKLEKTDLQYACLAKIVRDGGFKVALVARYSAIPGHFTTAVFSTCGMGVLVFALAAALSLPKQFVTVYIGVIIEQSGTGTETTKDKIISDSVLAITIIITCLAMWYMFRKMDEIKHDVIYQRRKARQAKLERAHSVGGSSVFNPRESDSDLPLNPGEDATYQQWDAHGQAAGYAGNPTLNHRVHAPTPQRVNAAGVSRIPAYRTEGGGGYSTSGERYGPPPGELESSTSTSRTMSPAHPPAPRHQESVDSVGWDAAGQGLGSDAVRLPTIHPHTPLSGGFTNVPLSANNPFNRSPLQQQQYSDSRGSPILPPLAPPPTSTQRSSNPYSPTSPSQYQSANPIAPMSTGPTVPQQPVPTTSAPYGTAITMSPPLQQYPMNIYPNPQSAPHSPLQTPIQSGFAYEPQPQSLAQMQSVASQPHSPAHAPFHTAFVNEPPSAPLNSAPFSSNRTDIGAHVQDASDSMAYYTPPHSCAPTEPRLEERLPTPKLPPPPEYRP